ncbi:SusC/RagA family TonB-linked outer membrane protein [Pontibacter indicus]|uniref:TonB-linked outer membrane protein, SusC/RagA family n=1 Tax=Pontibacter indicus TaxID=1317125 RepID=A0A1R3XRI7_9BACT|nr:SusC/RagA family TonB-linked outer membrane protein [Pontibacter indicus]SIT94053.1 TonB-linked outer membrane protein, SusC/RagA family [Pontibacter indicus]
MKRILFLLLLLLAYTLPARAQQPISGKVVSAVTNTPLPGAPVRLKGSSTGTMTDAEGNFTLARSRDQDTLQISYLGYLPYEAPLRLPLPDPFVIALQENSRQLREVVVSTGYQQLPQERATGSFAQVSKERFNEQVSTDVISRLEAVANGLTVDRGTDRRGRLMVRGLSTIMGPKAPLIVVDNFPYEGDINNINPNDIESVTVLKDAAAASIWGTRAGNGVIVITTKKGRFNQPLRLDFNTNVRMTEVPDLSYIPQMSSSDYIDTEIMLFGRGYYNSNINSVNRPALTPVVELLLQRRNGTLSEAEANARINALRAVDVRDEYNRHMYQRGVEQQYSLGLQGSSDKNAWLMSAGYDRNLSNLSASYDRFNLRFQNTLRPAKRLELSTGLYYTLSNSESGKPGYGQVTMLTSNLYPYARFADEAGNPLPVVKDYRQSWKETAGNGQLLDWNYYPLTDYRHSRTLGTLQDVLGNVGLSYKLPFGLEASLSYQYQRQQSSSEQLNDAQSYMARNMVNLYTQLDPITGEPVYRVPVGGILVVSEELIQSQSGRAQLGFNRTWGAHGISAIAGAEARQASTSGHGQRFFGFDENNLTFGQIDPVNFYPLITNGRTSTIQPAQHIRGMENRFLSVYGNAAYTFRERYTLSASARQDASNLFGVNANNRWNPLWSTGLAWNISEEAFYKWGALPSLKLRATYGYSGNVDMARTAVTTMTYRLIKSPLLAEPMAYIANHANPELRWERAGMFNLGLDFGSRNSRLSGSLEYFHKKGTNLYGWELADYTSGVGATMLRNVASMRGQGMDVELNSINLQAKRFSWSSHLNFSYFKDEVTDYYLGNQQASNFIASTPAISGLVGKPVYSIFSYPWAGLDPETGDPQGYLNGDVTQDYVALRGSEVQIDDLRYNGSAVPVYFGSLGNTLSFGNLSLTARLTYKFGYFFRRKSVNYNELYRNGEMHHDFANRWQQPGDEAITHVPSMPYPANTARDFFYSGSEVLVERGDHVRLQYISASYAFDKTTFKRLPFRQMQAYVNVSNLGLLWVANKQGIDPDYHLGTAPLPPARTYAIGLKASF